MNRCVLCLRIECLSLYSLQVRKPSNFLHAKKKIVPVSSATPAILLAVRRFSNKFSLFMPCSPMRVYIVQRRKVRRRHPVVDSLSLQFVKPCHLMLRLIQAVLRRSSPLAHVSSFHLMVPISVSQPVMLLLNTSTHSCSDSSYRSSPSDRHTHTPVPPPQPAPPSSTTSSNGFCDENGRDDDCANASTSTSSVSHHQCV